MRRSASESTTRGTGAGPLRSTGLKRGDQGPVRRQKPKTPPRFCRRRRGHLWQSWKTTKRGDDECIDNFVDLELALFGVPESEPVDLPATILSGRVDVRPKVVRFVPKLVPRDRPTRHRQRHGLWPIEATWVVIPAGIEPATYRLRTIESSWRRGSSAFRREQNSLWKVAGERQPSGLPLVAYRFYA